MAKNKTKAVTLSLTEQEENDLIQISEKFFGQSRYEILQQKRI
jgi:hypothetical protein